MAGQMSPDPSNAPPAPYCHQSDILLDGEKAGAALLVSGVLLGLIGVVFTILGWYHYSVNPSYEWTQLLGPILISVGGTFMLTSVCRFGIGGCWSCRHWDEDVFGMSGTEQTPARQPFAINGISQPIMLSGTTAVVCIPPPYNFATLEMNHPSGLHNGGSMGNPPAVLPPQYDAVCGAGMTAYRAEEEEEEEEEEGRRTDIRRSQKTERQEDEGRRQGESPSVSPPAYEDIYPSFNKHHQL